MICLFINTYIYIIYTSKIILFIVIHNPIKTIQKFNEGLMISTGHQYLNEIDNSLSNNQATISS